jgi:hypothetical protein
MNTATNTPKPKNQFAALPETDRKFILDLCFKTPYDEAVELLRRPRSEGGLNIITSRSALSRFYTAAQPEPHDALLAQFAAAANIRHEQQSNAFLGAIRAAIQARVLEHLNSGRALGDMQNDFKLLRTVESLYLADANFRAKHPKTARASKDYVQQCAEAPDTDFLPADETPSDSDPNPLHDPPTSTATSKKNATANRKSSTCSNPAEAKTPTSAKTKSSPPLLPHIPSHHKIHQKPPQSHISHQIQPKQNHPNQPPTSPRPNPAATTSAPAAATANPKNAATHEPAIMSRACAYGVRRLGAALDTVEGSNLKPVPDFLIS